MKSLSYWKDSQGEVLDLGLSIIMVINIIKSFLYTIAIFSLLQLPVGYTAEIDPAQLSKQRKIYIQAQAVLKSKQGSNSTRYQELKNQLINYPLLPYLDYREVRKTLKTLPYQRVDGFLEKNKGTYLGTLMLRQWLNILATKERWHDYRSYYMPIFNSARHECWYLWSRVKTGDPKALAETERLWNVAQSQPNECDPLFKEWQEAGFLTTDLLWQRHQKSLLENKKQMVRYLQRRMPEETRKLAVKFRRTQLSPKLLANKKAYSDDHPYMRDIVYFGLKRYARQQPDKAWQVWLSYQKTHNFTDEQVKSFYYSLTREYAFQGQQEAVKQHLPTVTPEQQISIIEIMLRNQLQQQDWTAVLKWLEYLPELEKQTDRWLYWHARASEALFKPQDVYQETYRALANNRSFYGFLAADQLNLNYSFQHQPTNVTSETLETLKQISGLARARELYHFEQLHHARQEWAYATDNLNDEEYQAVAKLSHSWGWYRKSIESMAAAKAWNDLDIRFPIVHKNIVHKQAQKSKLHPTLIFAIARQESAWETDAQSRAGAVGLMQLLPRTASSTAAKAGLHHRRSYLLKPEHNIALGSRYISELLEQYDNNRLPAIAAYNAGPSRVNRWLARSDNQLPHDIWIESIPFKETRKYVQNVLTYALVYSFRMGKKTTLLTQHESNNLL